MGLNATPPGPRSGTPSAGVSPLVKTFRLIGSFACFGIAVNTFVCMVRNSFTDGAALGPYAALSAVLLVSIWICRDEFLLTLKSTRMRVALNVALQAAVGLVLLGVGLYAFGHRYWTRVDLSTYRFYVLSEETMHALHQASALDEPIEIVYLEGSEPSDPEFRASILTDRTRVTELLTEYQAQADRIKSGMLRYSRLDMFNEPTRLEQLRKRLGIAQFTRNEAEAVVILRGERAQRVTRREWYAGAAYNQQGRATARAFQGERQITGRLRMLLADKLQRVLFTIGHGEQPKEELAPFFEFLHHHNFIADRIDLSVSGEVPDDASAVVVCGPREALAAEEIEKLRRYLDRGGRLWVLLDPTLVALPNQAREASGLNALLEPYGLAARQDYVARSVRPAVLADAVVEPELIGMAMLQTAAPLTKVLISERTGMIFKLPCALEVSKPTKEGFISEIQVQSAPYETLDRRHWADPVSLAKPRTEAGEDSLKGPVPLAAVAFDPQNKQAGKIVLLAESRILTGDYFTTKAGNQLFAQSVLRWLVDDDDLISAIPPKDPELRRAKMDEREGRVLMVLLVVGLPTLMIFAGIVVWAIRKT